MKKYQPSLEEQRLITTAKALIDRLGRLDTRFDTELANAKDDEIATALFILDLLTSGPNLTVHGWRYIAEQLALRESWFEDVSTTDSE